MTTKRTQVTCQYCGKPYMAVSKKSKYGCPNYSCNQQATVDRMDYDNERSKEWHRRKRQAEYIAKS